MTVPSGSIGALTALGLLLMPSVGARAFVQARSDSFAIRDVRVFDGSSSHEHQTVVVSSGRIQRVESARSARIPDGLDVIDGRGRTLLPGLIDSHVHVSPQFVERALRQALVFGVTTEIDMWTSAAGLRTMKRVETDDPPGIADVRTAGNGATAAGGHPSQMGGPPFPTIDAASDAQAFVDSRISEGSDFLKIILDDGSAYAFPKIPTLSKETLTALVQAAHARGKLAVVHIGSERQARDAIDAGADGLAHMFVGPSASPDFGRFVVRHHAFVIPTLSVLHWVCGQSRGPVLLSDSAALQYVDSGFKTMLSMPSPQRPASCAGTQRGMRELVAAGATILAGTDAPGPGTTYGLSTHNELQLLVSAGLSPSAALAAATSAAARAFRLADRGRIRPGARADLLLVQGDPTRDIAATRRIVMIWKKGVAVDRGAP